MGPRAPQTHIALGFALGAAVLFYLMSIAMARNSGH